MTTKDIRNITLAIIAFVLGGTMVLPLLLM